MENDLTPMTRAELEALIASGEPLDLALIDFGGAALCGLNMESARFFECSFYEADLSGAILRGAALLWCDFGDATLAEVDFGGAELFTSAFAGANLEGANLRDAKGYLMEMQKPPDFMGIPGMTGRYPNISHAVVTLEDANLAGADLSGADLRMAALAGANLDGANLHGTDLRDADLSGVDLSRVDLQEAILTP
jgi:uncharacterized protein YjbI with pentapeptide repeats